MPRPRGPATTPAPVLIPPEPVSFWEKPWQLVLIGVLGLLVLLCPLGIWVLANFGG